MASSCFGFGKTARGGGRQGQPVAPASMLACVVSAAGAGGPAAVLPSPFPLSPPPPRPVVASLQGGGAYTVDPRTFLRLKAVIAGKRADGTSSAFFGDGGEVGKLVEALRLLRAPEAAAFCAELAELQRTNVLNSPYAASNMVAFLAAAHDDVSVRGAALEFLGAIGFSLANLAVYLDALAACTPPREGRTGKARALTHGAQKALALSLLQDPLRLAIQVSKCVGGREGLSYANLAQLCHPRPRTPDEALAVAYALRPQDPLEKTLAFVREKGKARFEAKDTAVAAYIRAAQRVAAATAGAVLQPCKELVALAGGRLSWELVPQPLLPAVLGSGLFLLPPAAALRKAALITKHGGVTPAFVEQMRGLGHGNKINAMDLLCKTLEYEASANADARVVGALWGATEDAASAFAAALPPASVVVGVDVSGSMKSGFTVFSQRLTPFAAAVALAWVLRRQALFLFAAAVEPFAFPAGVQSLRQALAWATSPSCPHGRGSTSTNIGALVSFHAARVRRGEAPPARVFAILTDNQDGVVADEGGSAYKRVMAEHDAVSEGRQAFVVLAAMGVSDLSFGDPDDARLINVPGSFAFLSVLAEIERLAPPPPQQPPQ